MSITTAPVNVVKSGTSFTIDVTDANLLTDTTIKDFRVINTGTDVILANADFTKDSAIQLTYSGADIGTDVNLEVRRNTPVERFQEIAFQAKLSSVVLNTEFDRVLRRQAETALFGAGPAAAGIVNEPLNQAFGTGWQSDSIRGRTANVLYDKLAALDTKDSSQDTSIAANAAAILLRATLNSPTFTGTVTVPAPAETSDTTIPATTAWVRALLSRDCLIAERLTSQAFARNTVHSPSGYTEILDEGDNFAAGTYTVPADGLYLVGGSIRLEADTTNTLNRAFIRLALPAAAVRYIGDIAQGSSDTDIFAASGVQLLSLSQDDTVQLQIFGATSSGNWTTSEYALWVIRLPFVLPTP